MTKNIKLEDNELIVLVDDNGKQIKTAPKLASHHANTPLHLAFSSYLFDNKGNFLVTRRALSKKVWPGVWTNSCCGHLSPNETTEQALRRRVSFELGIEVADLTAVLKDYRYITPPFNGIVDHEICPVYFARISRDIKINHEEVEEYKWIKWDAYTSELEKDTEDIWSWWAKDQLKKLKKLENYKELINYFTN